MEEIVFAEMTVEARESTTAHGLKPYDQLGYTEQELLEDTLRFVEFAKTIDEEEPFPVNLLDKYLPFRRRFGWEEVLQDEFGIYSWAESTEFVRDDECIEFFAIVARWARHKGIKTRREDGFIDGAGFGIYRIYDRVAKPIMEKAFDAKYFFRIPRPVQKLHALLGFVCPMFANYNFPGHFSYPAGHSAKFFSAVKAAENIWHLDADERHMLLMFAYAMAMSRSGGGVHLPVDNVASAYFCEFPEFEQYGEPYPGA